MGLEPPRENVVADVGNRLELGFPEQGSGALMAFHEYIMGLWEDLNQMISEWIVEPFYAGEGGLLPGRVIALAAARLLDAYKSFDHFKSDWRWQRLLIPLQVRLFVEQVLWDRGLPWRSLITGFRAIEGAAGETGVVGPPLPPPLPSKTNALQTCLRNCNSISSFVQRSLCRSRCERRHAQ